MDNNIYMFSNIIFCSIAMATVSNTSPITTSEDSQNDLETDLNIDNTEDEIHMDTSNWTLAERKRLQHMTKFHEEYQQAFGEKASIHTIMKRRISHMNPPIPKSVCEEEMQNANLDTNEVIVEYITDAQGNKVKKLKPLLIKSEPDRKYVHHIHSDDNDTTFFLFMSPMYDLLILCLGFTTFYFDFYVYNFMSVIV